MNFVKLPRYGDGAPMLVNFDTVTLIAPEDSSTSTVWFFDDEPIKVNLSVDELAKRLVKGSGTNEQ